MIVRMPTSALPIELRQVERTPLVFLPGEIDVRRQSVLRMRGEVVCADRTSWDAVILWGLDGIVSDPEVE